MRSGWIIWLETLMTQKLSAFTEGKSPSLIVIPWMHETFQTFLALRGKYGLRTSFSRMQTRQFVDRSGRKSLSVTNLRKINSGQKNVQQKGYVIVYEPSAAVMHSHNETLRQAYRRALREASEMKEITKERHQPRGSILSLSHRIFLDWRFIVKNRYSPKWLIIAPF